MSPRNFRQRINKRRTRRSSQFANQDRVLRINNATTINRIVRITIPQITEDLIVNNFFNGSNFHDSNDNFESLILPAGSSQDQ
jgi:hypothetical protein